MADPTKSFLGQYELLEVIGDGTEGRVYKARCTSDSVPGVAAGELVAVKRLKSTGHEKESHQFLRQIKILSKLNHPNIVRHKDSFVWREKELEEDVYCLVMELLDGEPLKSLIGKHRGGLPWELAGGILSQILQALQYASKNGVIHRDLKTSNIFIARDGTPKLVDFGIARQDDGEATATSSAAGAKGTFDYMAPDYARIHDGFRGDEQSDIFSFGVILYFTLTGTLPFPPLGEHADRGYYLRWLGPQPPTAEFRHPIFRFLSHARSCISKCIAMERSERFKTFDEVMADFAQIGYRKLTHGGETYEFTGWLGKGGFGEVFRARRRNDQRVVAIKRLFITGQSARFVREAKILRAAAHPNLTEYVDFVEVRVRDDEREYYLILEYLEGMPDAGLRNRIKNSDNGLDPAEALQIFVHYLDCLEHLHKNGIIHRDIKPGNLYAPAGDPHRAKIFDLGIAHDLEGTRTHGQVPGTLDFMPPEFAKQTSGRGSALSDIYSIGVTLYQALTKKLPFPPLPTKESEAWVVFFERSEKPLGCPFDHPVFTSFPELANLLRRALAHDPKRRYASAGEMREGIKNLLRKWSAPVADYDEEQPTAITMAVKPAARQDEIEENATEAATRAANLQEIERELARAAQVAAATQMAPAMDPAEAERLAQERTRMAAEEAERQRIEDERLALIRAERAAQRRKTMAKVAKVGAIFAAIIALAAGGYFGWNKYQAWAVENKFAAAVSAAEIAAQQNKHETVVVEADKALTIYPTNPAMLKLKADAQIAINNLAAYKDTMSKAQAAFKAGDFTNVVKFTGDALLKKPGDLEALKLREAAQTKLNDYHAAVAAANSDAKQNKHETAVAEADKALAIYPKDSAMQKLKTDAQGQLKLRDDNTTAYNNAKTAFENGDYTNTVAWAAKAVKLIPSDANAAMLRDKAQTKLNDYRSAVNQANAAFKNNNFEDAKSNAVIALAIYPKDSAMLKLKDDAQGQLKRRDDNRTAYNNAETALKNGDYTNTVAWAKEAVKLIASDTNAAMLRDKAQTKLDIYHAAVRGANSAAAQQNKHEAVVAEAEKALAVYPNDAAMQNLKKNAQKKIDDQRAYDDAMAKAQAALDGQDYTVAISWAEAALQKFPNNDKAKKLRDDAQKLLNDFSAWVKRAQTATNFVEAVTFAEQALHLCKHDAMMIKLKNDILLRLDRDLVKLLRNFQEAVPKKMENLVDEADKPFGTIGNARNYYYEQANKLKEAYRAGNWLEGYRETSLQVLLKRILNWD